MGKKYQTSFQYQSEEKKMHYFKALLIFVIVVAATLVFYDKYAREQDRIAWIDELIHYSISGYEESVNFIAEYIPVVGEWTGVAPENYPDTAPVKETVEKIKVYRSNKAE